MTVVAMYLTELRTLLVLRTAPGLPLPTVHRVLPGISPEARDERLAAAGWRRRTPWEERPWGFGAEAFRVKPATGAPSVPVVGAETTGEDPARLPSAETARAEPAEQRWREAEERAKSLQIRLEAVEQRAIRAEQRALEVATRCASLEVQLADARGWGTRTRPVGSARRGPRVSPSATVEIDLRDEVDGSEATARAWGEAMVTVGLPRLASPKDAEVVRRFVAGLSVPAAAVTDADVEGFLSRYRVEEERIDALRTLRMFRAWVGASASADQAEDDGGPPLR